MVEAYAKAFQGLNSDYDTQLNLQIQQLDVLGPQIREKTRQRSSRASVTTSTPSRVDKHARPRRAWS